MRPREKLVEVVRFLSPPGTTDTDYLPVILLLHIYEFKFRNTDGGEYEIAAISRSGACEIIQDAHGFDDHRRANLWHTSYTVTPFEVGESVTPEWQIKIDAVLDRLRTMPGFVSAQVED
jgi:hypothetical protein